MLLRRSLTRALASIATAVLHQADALPLPDRALASDYSPAVVGNIRIPNGYTRTLFSDGFDGTAINLPSTERWTIDTGTQYSGGPAHWGTGEVETYVEDHANLYLTGTGTLMIRPIQTATGEWTSGRIETAAAYDFACAAGGRLRIEARLRLGGGAATSQLGIWMAFWLLGTAYRGNYQNWPAIGEIDILESLNGQDKAFQTVHCGTISGGPCKETTGLGHAAAFMRGVWNTVAVVIDRSGSSSNSNSNNWRQEYITWLINEQPVFTVAATTVNDETAWAALAHSTKFLLLNVAVGGGLPDALAGKTTPTSATVGDTTAVSMEVDHVAVFST